MFNFLQLHIKKSIIFFSKRFFYPFLPISQIIQNKMIAFIKLIVLLILWENIFSSCRIASWSCQHISTLLGLRWELRGREHLEKNRACIIVVNHQSSLDVLGMFDLWPVMDKCTAVAKKEIFYAWPVGLAAWLCGLIFIDRMNSEKARSALNTATKEIKDKKVVVLGIFVLIYTICFLLYFSSLHRLNCGYSLRELDVTLVRYIHSRRVPSMSRSDRSYPYYQSYSLLIISYPRKRRDLIPVSKLWGYKKIES